MKAKRIFQFLLPVPLILLSACSTTNSIEADALRKTRGSTAQMETESAIIQPAPELEEISVLPASLLLESGQRGTVAFSLSEAVTESDLNLAITTDIPNSVIMPEAAIPAGERSINIPMEGSEPGEGFLFIEADGYQSITIPITVR